MYSTSASRSCNRVQEFTIKVCDLYVYADLRPRAKKRNLFVWKIGNKRKVGKFALESVL